MRHEIQPGVWLDSRRAVYFANERVLAIADLHWGYASSHRAAGNLLPLWGDAQIGESLDRLIADYQPNEMLWVGDSVHDVNGRRAADEFLKRSPVKVHVLAGNHDRRWEPAAFTIAQRGNYHFHHGNETGAVPEGSIEVIGHFHPAFEWWDGAGARMKVPALVHGPNRIILPAFSPWAAGAPWNNSLRDHEQLWVVGEQRIFAVTPALLRKARGLPM